MSSLAPLLSAALLPLALLACAPEPEDDPVPDGDTGDPPVEDEPEDEVIDVDGDGHPPLSEGGDDCDDEDPDRYPGAPERCDGLDNDCDDVIDPDVFFVSAAGETTHLDPADMDDADRPAELVFDEPGDLHFCAPGTYAARVRLEGGGDSSVIGAGIDETVLLAGGAGAGISVRGTSGQSLRVQDLTVSGGAAESGGGIWFNQGTLVLDGVEVRESTATDSGAGIYIGPGTAAFTISNSRVVGNIDADYGGGLYVGGGVGGITDSVFTSNAAHESGGGIYVSQGPVELVNTTLTANAVLGEGGALTIASGTVDARNVVFDTNSSLNRGGAVSVEEGAELDARGVELRDNTATYGGAVRVDDGTALLVDATLTGNSGGYGAAIYMWNGTLRLVGESTLQENTGSAVILTGSDGGSSYSRVTLSGVTATDNPGRVLQSQYADITLEESTLSGGGGAVRIHIGYLTSTDVVMADHTDSAASVHSCQCDFERTTFSGNTAENGGGLFIGDNYFSGNYVQGTDCTFEGNTPDDIFWDDRVSGGSTVMGEETSFSY